MVGPDHPDTVLSLTNLAVLLMDQGELAAALALLERALAIREQVLGTDHPDTTSVRAKLERLIATSDSWCKRIFRHLSLNARPTPIGI